MVARLILTYLVPCHIVNTHTIPSRKLLEPFPRLESLFRPLCNCIKQGDLVGFDAAMSAGADEFAKRRIYLPLERGRDLALRNLFRKVFINGGYEPVKPDQPAPATPIRRTRVPVVEFAAALRIGTKADDRSRIDMDEVECLLANLIYKVIFSLFGIGNITNSGAESDERVHLPGTKHGCPQQEWCFSGNGSMM